MMQFVDEAFEGEDLELLDGDLPFAPEGEVFNDDQVKQNYEEAARCSDELSRPYTEIVRPAGLGRARKRSPGPEWPLRSRAPCREYRP